jgi:DNA-binding transcriptional LysR family regulator
LTQPTLGRQVAALEDELGVTLFERAGRGLVPTPAGLDLLEHVRVMGAAALKVSLAATGQSEAVAGRISITASEFYAAHLLPPILARLRHEAPGIEVEVVSANEVVNLIRREADIAIRNTRPEQPDLVARKLGDDTGGFFASRAYVERHGPFDTVEDMSRATIIAFSPPGQLLELLRGFGLPVTERSVALHSASHLVQWALMKQGLGICVGSLRAGRADADLVQILPELLHVPFPVWLTTHGDLHRSRRVRLVFDLLAEMLPGMLTPPDRR